MLADRFKEYGRESEALDDLPGCLFVLGVDLAPDDLGTHDGDDVGRSTPWARSPLDHETSKAARDPMTCAVRFGMSVVVGMMAPCRVRDASVDGRGDRDAVW